MAFAAYASVTDIIARKSVQTLGDLVSDDGVRVVQADLIGPPVNAVLQAALDSAAGEIEAACLVGGRYTVENLIAIFAAAAASSLRNTRSHLVRINCEIAYTFLLSRKPSYSVEDYKAAMELQEVYLERLRKGENVFNIAANIEAGTPSVAIPTVVSVQAKGFIRDRTLNTFPARTSSSG
jgi:phage gp36-like protein